MSSFSIIQTCLDVADLRCLRAEAGWLAGDGEQGGDAQGDPAKHHSDGDDSDDDGKATDLPGTCSTSIQKLTQDTITMRMVGT